MQSFDRTPRTPAELGQLAVAVGGAIGWLRGRPSQLARALALAPAPAGKPGQRSSIAPATETARLS